MILRATFACLIATVVAQAAAAVPPPPPPEKYNASWTAVDALNPFLGKWTGTETQHTKFGNNQTYNSDRHVFWNLSRLSGKDVILCQHGTNNGPPFTEFSNVLTFDPILLSYRMYLPGYRLFTDNDRTSELVTAAFTADGRLSWSATKNDGSKRRTTIWLEKSSTWHERVEDVSTSGEIILVSEATLTKAPA